MELDENSKLPLRLRNLNCPYCGVDLASLAPDDRNRDHVIGQRFVPKGIQDWNLIVATCTACNTDAKAQLENDISAITMQPDAHGRFADPALAAEAKRKGKTKSQATGKPVSESQSKFTVGGNFGKAKISFGFTGPPRVQLPRVYDLARYHVAGFWFLSSYEESSKRGATLPSPLYPIAHTLRSDWGNPAFLGFADMVRTWGNVSHIVTAEGFFKVMIRRSDTEPDLFAWALEWNKNMRVLGFLGKEQAARDAYGALPWPPRSKGYRKENPMPCEVEDTLFRGPSSA